MEFREVSFWTSVLHNWNRLLIRDEYKTILTDSLAYLHRKELIKVYGFVIMPNHVHMIWEMLEMNGKEKPYASFAKFTAHEILKRERESGSRLIDRHKVNKFDRDHLIWQRDPLALRIRSRAGYLKVLNYIHNNPLQAHWQLVSYPEDYYFSSAKFYRTGENDFPFLSHFEER